MNCLSWERNTKGRMENFWNFKFLNPSSASEVRCPILLGSYCPQFGSSSLCHWANQHLPAVLICKSFMCLLCYFPPLQTPGPSSLWFDSGCHLDHGPLRFVCEGPPRSIFSQCLHLFCVSWLPATLNITTLYEYYKLNWRWFKFTHTHTHTRHKSRLFKSRSCL